MCEAALGNVRISARSPGGLVDHRVRKCAPSLALHYGGITGRYFRGCSLVGPGGMRGVICGFSLASLARYRAWLIDVDWCATKAFWVTLTYHDNWGISWEDWKRDLRVLQKRMDRYFKDLMGDTWRLEFQRRGAPHFHLIVGFRNESVVSTGVLESWFRENWIDIVGMRGDGAAWDHAVKVIRVSKNRSGDGIGQLVGYVVKDAMKVDQAEYVSEYGEKVMTGRVWGRRGNLPVREALQLECTPQQWEKVISALSERARGHGSFYLDHLSPLQSGFCVLGPGMAGGSLREMLVEMGLVEGADFRVV
jgi:hypothetical protein